MATMRRKSSALVAALAGLLPAAHGQKLDIKPGVEAQAKATDNAFASSQTPRKDMVLTVSPELNVSYWGAHARLSGHVKVDSISFARNSEQNRTLPSGDLIFQSDLIDQWAGIDASLQTSQTAPNELTPPDGPITDTYTTTNARISPFISHSFGDGHTKLNARLQEALVKSSASNNLAPRPDQRYSSQSARLEREPVPIGASLEWTAQETRDSGRTANFKENATRAGVSYAVTSEVYTGLIYGRGTLKTALDQQDETIKGVTLFWRPNERATLDSKVERRFFGTGWRVDWNHRTPLFAWSVLSERDASTYASSLGTMRTGQTLRDLLDRMLTTGTPNDRDRADLVDQTIAQRGLTDQLPPLQDPYSLSPTLRQATRGRLILMGQRNTVSFAGGMNKNDPLTLGAVTAIGDHTLERYVEADFSRRLTPLTTLNTGVRWSTQSQASQNANLTGRVRTITWRGDISTRLSQQATATFGLKSQNSQGNLPSANANDESAMFVGLGYRY